MYTLNLTVIIFASMLSGALAGAFLMYRGIHPKSRQQLEAQLQDCERQLKQYKNQISDHFDQTATLVENLNVSYHELQNHLISSAEQLINNELQQDTLYPRSPNYSHGSIKRHMVKPPLDYAPKKGEPGTLSEGYRLKEDQTKNPPSSEAYTELK